MCNYRRDNSREIPKTGRGFKIVSDYGDGKWEAPIKRITFHKHNVWDEDYSYHRMEFGFCFFMTFSDASILLNEMLNEMFNEEDRLFQIVEIEYKGGICIQKESYNWVGYNSCLCKEFTFIDYPICDNKEE